MKSTQKHFYSKRNVLFLLGRLLGSNEISFSSDGTNGTFRVMFKEPIEIQHNTNYTASATLKVIIVFISATCKGFFNTFLILVNLGYSFSFDNCRDLTLTMVRKDYGKSAQSVRLVVKLLSNFLMQQEITTEHRSKTVKFQK